MPRWLEITLCWTLFTAVMLAALAAEARCRDAADAVESVKSDAETRARRYMYCVQASDGQDGCDHEFRRLRSAHGDFESAVSQRQSECR